jgi:hypothetical protein
MEILYEVIGGAKESGAHPSLGISSSIKPRLHEQILNKQIKFVIDKVEFTLLLQLLFLKSSHPSFFYIWLALVTSHFLQVQERKWANENLQNKLLYHFRSS